MYWLIPVFALGVAGWLVYREFIHTGYELTIRFRDAAGIEAGKSTVQYRGVRVGVVNDVVVAPDRQTSVVKLSLQRRYADLAREGTQFWIVRPRISTDRISGLSALTSQNFIRLELGTGTAGVREFIGREVPPPGEGISGPEEGLRLRLLAPRRWGLAVGSPVYYRGVEAGEVRSYQVSADGGEVIFEVAIRQAFAPLVQGNSKFWNVSGVEFSTSLFTGMNFEMDDWRTVLGGGVEFATPPERSPPVPDDFSFRLYEKPEAEWRDWRPARPSGALESGPESADEGESWEGRAR